MALRVSRNDMRQTDIQKTLMNMAGRYSAYEIFIDWIQCIALSISNSLEYFHGKIWQERESIYQSVIQKYDHNEQLNLSQMNAWLVEELENNPRDVLGEIFMKSGMGSDAGGQFFTPFNLSLMMAEVSVNPPEDGEVITLNEPSCGSGGGIIAAALALKNKGVNYQRCMKVVAQDLDWRCVYMCYVQMSFLGINGICVQGNTLLEPYNPQYPPNKILRTPMAMGVLL